MNIYVAGLLQKYSKATANRNYLLLSVLVSILVSTLLSLAGAYGTLGVLTNLIKVQAIGLTMDCKITTNIHL